MRPGPALMCCLALAWPAASGAGESLDEVAVTGTRRSLESAQARKRDARGIVDAVVADEIHKLPDLSVADALQRVTGVQMTRDRGEGALAAVRGLLQVETTLNGRELFTAGSGRTMDFSDLTAEALAGIDVHKTSSADHIEGGLGGRIDLRTRRPFDFTGDTGLLAGRVLHGHLAGRSAGQGALLLSRRGAAGGGELGLLLNLALQDRYWREDQKSSGTPVRHDDPAGGTFLAPGATSETTSVGRRRRVGASALLQWRPSAALEWYGELHFAELETRQDSHQINVSAPAGTAFEPGSLQRFPGSDDARRVTWLEAPVSLLNFARDTVDRTRQLAAGARWSGTDWQLEADLSLTRSFNHLFFSGPFLAATAGRFTHDLSGAVPGSAVAGAELGDPASWRYTGLAYRTRPFRGQLQALRLDLARTLDAGPIERVEVGWRHARRRADNAPGLAFGDVALPGPGGDALAGRLLPNPATDFLDGRADSITGHLIGALDDARDPAGLRAAFGITTPLPAGGGPLTVWRIREDSDAVYLQLPWRAGTALDGQAGLRVVHTRRTTDSAQVLGSGAPEAIRGVASETDTLPSASLRWRAAPGWQLRAAASRTLTRPDFNQLSPSLLLLPNPVDPNLNQGSAGNPGLRPMRSTNLDLGLEREAGRGAGASLALFWKQVDGFVFNLAQPEAHDGAVYVVSRPRNADRAQVRGAELAWQGFFEALPGAWSGLGLQANYTHVDSRTFDRVLGREVALQGLSRHSVNLAGLYERGAWSARLAWNWRSRFASGVVPVVDLGGAQQVWTRAHGWLDASIRWRVSPRLTWALDGVNLSRTLRRSDLGSVAHPRDAWVNDRQLATSLSLQF
ncbi:MAG: TonB-dependent receptor [Piscinibacter sp.]|nr:TonB-dependent receptor [Piscinibacter sp.]